MGDKKYLIGFDCGTYESKGCCCDTEGNVVATAVEKHTLLIPQPGFAEHDPINHWWREFKLITKKLIEKAGITNDMVVGIGVSTVMAAVTAVDENLNPLRNAILYGIDSRSTKQANDLNRTIGEERLKEICGMVCSNESFGPKINWIKENEPDIFAKTKRFTFAAGFLTAKLTGEFVVDYHSVSAAHPMIDVRSYTWHEEMCSYVCPSSMLPRICHSTDVVGYVTEEAALETGLAVGTPVVCGTTDAAAEALSAGVVEANDTMLMYGSTAFMLNLSKEKLTSEKVWHAPYIIKGLYDNCGGMGTTGSLTNWVKNVMGKDLIRDEEAGKENAYDALFGEAEGIEAGSDGLIVLPYFLGRRMAVADPDAKGVIFGLKLHHTRGHIVHAVFEGIGYGIAQLFDLLSDSSIELTEVRAIGGGTKTPLWLQIVSDITGLRQIVPKVKIGAAYGDALMAGLGVGAIESPQKVKEIIKVDYVIEPDAGNVKKYEKYKELYAKLYAQTQSLMHSL